MSSRLSGVATGMEGLSLDLTQAAKSSGVKKYLDFVISGWYKKKIGWIKMEIWSKK